jgi:hypothetical protein
MAKFGILGLVRGHYLYQASAIVLSVACGHLPRAADGGQKRGAGNLSKCFSEYIVTPQLF